VLQDIIHEDHIEAIELLCGENVGERTAYHVIEPPGRHSRSIGIRLDTAHAEPRMRCLQERAERAAATADVENAPRACRQELHHLGPLARVP
jgi:hypothetical protein